MEKGRSGVHITQGPIDSLLPGMCLSTVHYFLGFHIDSGMCLPATSSTYSPISHYSSEKDKV